MAVGIPVPGVVLVRLKGIIGLQNWNNVLHLQYAGQAPSVADLNSVGTSVISAWTTNIAPLCNVNVNLTGVDLADLTNPGTSTTSVTQNVPGTRAGTGLVTSAACVSSWQINIRYRGGHPRTYWPTGVDTDLQANKRLWTTTFVTAMTNGVSAFRTALNAITVSGTTYKMVAVSLVFNGAPRAVGVPYTINNVVIHGRVDTQRHRLGKETP